LTGKTVSFIPALYKKQKLRIHRYKSGPYNLNPFSPNHGTGVKEMHLDCPKFAHIAAKDKIETLPDTKYVCCGCDIYEMPGNFEDIP